MTSLLRLLCTIAFGALLLVPAISRADDDDDERPPNAGPVAVAEIGPDSATVSATLRLNGGSAVYWFEYGTSSQLGRRTPVQTMPKRDDDVVVSRVLSGLTPGTTYHVRLVAAGDGGRDEGARTTFTTAAAATPPPAPGTAPAPPAEPAPQPSLGVSVVAAAERGTVRVRPPGSDRAVELSQAASVPVGTVVDARRGTIALTTALPRGGVQRGSFSGARFQVRQPAGAHGRTDLYLRGGSFSACRRRTLASAASAGRKPPVRRLWGKDRHGRFRTHGRDSVTTVRGTEWSVADHCAGTVTRVTEGAVDVRVRRTGRVVRVRAGERFLARHRK